MSRTRETLDLGAGGWIAMGFSSDGRTLIAASSDGGIASWSLDSVRRNVDRASSLGAIHDLAQLPEARGFIAAAEGGAMELDLAGEPRRVAPELGALQAVAVSPRGGGLAFAASGEAWLQADLQSEPGPRVEAGERNASIAFDPAGRCLAITASGAGGSSLRIYSVEGIAAPRVSHEIALPEDAISGGCFALGGARFVCAGHLLEAYAVEDGARAWALDAGGNAGVEHPASLLLEHFWSRTVPLGPRKLACAPPQGGALFVVDADTGALIERIPVSQFGVSALAASPAGDSIAVAGFDGRLELIRLA